MSDETAVVDETAVADEAVTEEQQEISELSKVAGAAKNIPISLIVKSEIALRDVDTSTEAFQKLLASVKKKGVYNSILVREIEEDGVTKYGLVDGLQRYTCAKAAGHTEIPANVVSMDDAELLEAQIITNMQRVVTKPAQFGKHLVRIVSRNPTITLQKLADDCCQSVSWVSARLSLNKLMPDIQKLVDEGNINLTSAFALAKLPEEEQEQYVDAAMSESPKTFIPKMKARAKEIKDAKNKGRDTEKAVWRPQQYLRKIAVVQDELSFISGEGDGVSSVVSLLESAKIPVNDVTKQTAKIVLEWALNFDEMSKKEQEQDHAERAKKAAEAKELKKKQREAAKEKAAKEKAASIEESWA